MPRRNRSSQRFGGVRGTECISAVVSTGLSQSCYMKDINLFKSRSFRCVRAQITCSIKNAFASGASSSALVEVTMFNQGQTKISTTGPVMVGQQIRTFSISPPSHVDAWFDEGNTTSSTLKLLSLDVPCIVKGDSTKVHFLIKVHYELGPEIYDDACPSFRILGGPYDEEQQDSEPRKIRSPSSCDSLSNLELN